MAAGSFQVKKISGTDKSRAVKRAVSDGAKQVRITEGQRKTIVSRAKSR